MRTRPGSAASSFLACVMIFLGTPAVAGQMPGIDERLDEVLIEKVFHSLKARKALSGTETFDHWEKNLSPGQRGRFLSGIRDRATAGFVRYTGADGNEYLRYSDGKTIIGDRLALPKGRAPVEGVVDAFLHIIAEDLMKNARLGGVTGYEEIMGDVAEAGGRLRQSLAHYLAELGAGQISPDADRRLREKIISLARRIEPSLAVPAEVERVFAQGCEAAGAAGAKKDFEDAAAMLEKALRKMPWVPGAYYCLAVLQDRAGLYSKALQSLGLYLFAAPEAKDSGQVKALVLEIESRQALAGKEEAVRASRPAEALGGLWSAGYYLGGGEGSPSWKETYRLEGQGTVFELILVDPGVSPFHGSPSEILPGKSLFRLELDGTIVKGVYFQRFRNEHGCNPPKDQPVTGEVRDDGRTIELSFKVVQASPVTRSKNGPVIGCTAPDRTGVRIVLHKAQTPAPGRP